eukprot:scaffold41813_cov22-Tisochrysis_lutea.AAC.2
MSVATRMTWRDARMRAERMCAAMVALCARTRLHAAVGCTFFCISASHGFVYLSCFAWFSGIMMVLSSPSIPARSPACEAHRLTDIAISISQCAATYKPKFAQFVEPPPPQIQLHHLDAVSLPSLDQLPTDLHQKLEVLGVATLKAWRLANNVRFLRQGGLSQRAVWQVCIAPGWALVREKDLRTDCIVASLPKDES